MSSHSLEKLEAVTALIHFKTDLWNITGIALADCNAWKLLGVKQWGSSDRYKETIYQKKWIIAFLKDYMHSI